MQNRRSGEGPDPFTHDTFAAISTATVAAVIFWAAILTTAILLLAIMAALVLAGNVAPGVAGVAFAALCVWLTVRIINRRERWAIRVAVSITVVAASILTLAGLLFYLDMYVIGGGP